MNNEKETVTARRTVPTWAIALLVLGFPLWFSLIVAAVAVVFALYISVWAIIISLWAIWLSLIAYVLAGFVAAPVLWFHGKWNYGMIVLGSTFYCAGLVILGFFGCIAASKTVVRLTKKAALFVKKKISGKENAQ